MCLKITEPTQICKFCSYFSLSVIISLHDPKQLCNLLVPGLKGKVKDVGLTPGGFVPGNYFQKGLFLKLIA